MDISKENLWTGTQDQCQLGKPGPRSTEPVQCASRTHLPFSEPKQAHEPYPGVPVVLSMEAARFLGLEVGKDDNSNEVDLI